MQTNTFDSPAHTNGEENKGFWKSSDGTQNIGARFHFCGHGRDYCFSFLGAN